MKAEDTTRLASQPPPSDENNGEQNKAYDIF